MSSTQVYSLVGQVERRSKREGERRTEREGGREREAGKGCNILCLSPFSISLDVY